MTEGSWGVELWDQSDNVLKHTSDQISTTDTYYKLLSEYQRLQHDFGKRLRKAITAYMPKKKPSEDDLTSNAVFLKLLQSLANLGGCYEMGAKQLGDQVVASLKHKCENDKKDLEVHRTTLLRANTSLEALRKQLDSTWQKYVVAFREMQKSQDHKVKADNDMQLPRIEQQKAADILRQKTHAFEQAKGQYAIELMKYNTGMRQHYNKNMVEFLEDVELKDRGGVERAKELLMIMNSINDNTSTQLGDCNRQVREAIMELDSNKDAQYVIKRYKSGDVPPVDLPFLELDLCSSTMFDGNPSILGAHMLGLGSKEKNNQLSSGGPGANSQGGSTGGVLGLGGFRKPREDWANLRSPFVCDMSTKSVKEADFTILQVSDRLKSLSDQIKKTEAEKQGTQRLLEAYQNNPSLGNSKLVEPKEEILQHRITSLNAYVTSFKNRFNILGGEQALAEAQSRSRKNAVNSPIPSTVTKSLNTDGYESDNSFESDTEDNVTGPVPPPPDLRVRSVIGGPPPPPPPARNSAGSNYVGYATVKFQYEGNPPLYLPAQPGETFYVLELDSNNSGWTSVVSENGGSKGFVPTGFIEVTLY